MNQMAHKIELKATNKQKTYFRKACGISRFTWNWALDNWTNYYHFNSCLPKEDRDYISGMMLKKEFNQLKKSQFPWIMEVSKYVAQQPFIQLDRAYKRFFTGVSKRPKFKKKNKSKDSFYIGGDQLKVDNKKVWVPNLGWVKMREQLRFKGQVRSGTFSRVADRWYVSIQVDTEIKQIDVAKKSIGVDLGVNKLVQLSNGQFYESPKPLKNNLRRLKRRQRKLSKKSYLSKNYYKQKLIVQRLHRRIKNIRHDTLNRLTTKIVKSFDTIVIEDLNVSGMLKNHKLARAISDMGFYEFRRQLDYKTKNNGTNLIIADRFFPSSKRCFQCHSIKEDLKLGDRIYNCDCGLKLDRDYNSALNLESLVNNKLRSTGSKVTPMSLTPEKGSSKGR